MNNLTTNDIVEIKATGLIMKVVTNNGVMIDCEFVFAPIKRSFEIANDELRFLSHDKDLTLTLEPDLKEVIAKRNTTLEQIIADLNKPKAKRKKRPLSMDERIVTAKNPKEVREILREFGMLD